MVVSRMLACSVLVETRCHFSVGHYPFQQTLMKSDGIVAPQISFLSKSKNRIIFGLLELSCWHFWNEIPFVRGRMNSQFKIGCNNWIGWHLGLAALVDDNNNSNDQTMYLFIDFLLSFMFVSNYWIAHKCVHKILVDLTRVQEPNSINGTDRILF